MNPKTARLAALLPLILLAACATGPGRPTRAERIDAEKLASWNNLKQCLYDTAVQLDDGSQTAPAVAAEVAPLCAPAFNRFETSFVALTPSLKDRFQAKQAPKRVTFALNMVLKHREDYTAQLRAQTAGASPGTTGL